VSGALFTLLLVSVLCALILGLALAWGQYLARPPPWGGKTEQKALDLLKQWLSSVQLAQYKSTGHFDVTGQGGLNRGWGKISVTSVPRTAGR